jgi:3-keto-disaccharide hydrolase
MRIQIGPQMLRMLGMATLGLALSLAASAQAKPSIPPHSKLVPLFNGKDLTGFDTLLEKQGINSDPNKVFQVEKGVLNISGQEFGGLVTQKEYENYYLRAEFKWGEKTYAPRDGKARDSGIQYNITGPLKVWPRMMEFQINEGGTGDMWVVGGTGVTVDGKVYESTSSGPGAYIRIPHIGRGPLVNVTGHRDPVNDLERPHGKWNVLELVVDHDRILYFVNGKLAILGTKANTTKGKILFQCEGSEVYFRKMKIAMLR